MAIVLFKRRYMLGWLIPPKFSFLKLLRIYMKQTGDEPPNLMAQDFGYPIELLADALNHVDSMNKIYPLWLCPITCLKDQLCSHQTKDGHSGLHIDVGIYG